MPKKNEVGILLRVGTSFNMSSNTSLAMKIKQPDGTILAKTPTLETNLVSTTLGDFAANESIRYTFVTDDLDQTGEYEVEVTYNDTGGGPDIFISDTATFTVTDVLS